MKGMQYLLHIRQTFADLDGWVYGFICRSFSSIESFICDTGLFNSVLQSVGNSMTNVIAFVLQDITVSSILHCYCFSH